MKRLTGGGTAILMPTNDPIRRISFPLMSKRYDRFEMARNQNTAQKR
jgi:hypothetical protein